MKPRFKHQGLLPGRYIDTSTPSPAHLYERIAEMEKQLDELRTTGQALLDATGHSTWSKLFKAPQVETAIRDFKEALQGKSDE